MGGRQLSGGEPNIGIFVPDRNAPSPDGLAQVPPPTYAHRKTRDVL
jgi:hypothetical protein